MLLLYNTPIINKMLIIRDISNNYTLNEAVGCTHLSKWKVMGTKHASFTHSTVPDG